MNSVDENIHDYSEETTRRIHERNVDHTGKHSNSHLLNHDDNEDNEVIKNSNNKKLLGINLNNKLGFHTRVANTCERVSKKLHALARIS